MRIKLDVALASATTLRWAAALPLLAITTAISPRATAARIEVRGAASIEARARTEGAGIAVLGTLRDEASAPIASARVTMEIVASDADARSTVDRAEAAPGETALPVVEACTPDHRDAPRPAPNGGADGLAYELPTDDRGAFCARIAGGTGARTVRLRYDGGSLYDAAAADVPLASSRHVVLQLSPDTAVVSIDRGEILWTAVARVQEADASETPGASLALTLGDERGRAIGTATTDAAGGARFDVSAAALGPPGLGELRLSFAGGSSLPDAHLVRRVERHATVRITPAASSVEGAPEEGLALEVAVGWSGGKVPSGAVEATIDGKSVGAATVRDGRAAVIVTFAPEGADASSVSLRYVPDSPYWEPGATAAVRIVPAPPGPWRRAPLALVAVAIAWWVLRGWRRQPEPTRRTPSTRRTTPGSPSIAVVRAGSASGGWTGRVFDAHDGSPLPSASIALVAPTFAGESIAATARTAADGSFTIAPLRAERGARLRVEAPWHATLERALPPPGEVTIAMVSRRRKLLDRLVEWTRGAGAPWQPSPEPTPGQIARIAERMRGSTGAAAVGPSPERVEAWAHAVEDAAYGTAPVDEGTERDVGTLEPRGR